MVVFVEHAAESVASSYVMAGDLVRGQERRRQWLEQAGVRDPLMRPVPVVELLKLPQGVQKVGLVPVGFQNSAIGPDLDFYATRSYSLTRPPRTGRRWIRFRERSATG
jgi:hypothetical protein